MSRELEALFAGQSVWVIGASSGIGRSLVLELASNGCSVIASARNENALKKLQTSSSGRITPLKIDVTEEGSIAAALDSLAALNKEPNRLPDSVIFMAAYYEPTEIQSIGPEDLEHTIRVNLWAPLELCRLLTPKFYERGSGQIAMVASVAGYRGLIKGQPYSATKAGLINFAESLYLEAKPKGVDVKLINPGFVETSMTDKNQFVMPDIVSPEEAAKQIVKGLSQPGFEIHFPKRFTRKLKFLALLPYKLYFRLAQKF